MGVYTLGMKHIVIKTKSQNINCFNIYRDTNFTFFMLEDFSFYSKLNEHVRLYAHKTRNVPIV